MDIFEDLIEVVDDVLFGWGLEKFAEKLQVEFVLDDDEFAFILLEIFFYCREVGYAFYFPVRVAVGVGSRCLFWVDGRKELFLFGCPIILVLFCQVRTCFSFARAELELIVDDFIDDLRIWYEG